MRNIVYIKTYDAPEYNQKEILRYAGVKETSKEIAELMQSCLDEIKDKLVYKVCYAQFPISFCGKYLDLSFAKTDSVNLQRNLNNCDSFVLFAATVGIELDRLIARYAKVSPAKALMLQAIGTERIESLCDTFNHEIKEQMALLAKKTVPRFSPGYGDLPIEIQRDIFRVLDCPRKIGITLNKSLLMSPSKSVTAIIGISDGAK